MEGPGNAPSALPVAASLPHSGLMAAYKRTNIRLPVALRTRYPTNAASAVLFITRFLSKPRISSLAPTTGARNLLMRQTMDASIGSVVASAGTPSSAHSLDRTPWKNPGTLGRCVDIRQCIAKEVRPLHE
jgi:hypothetical protein